MANVLPTGLKFINSLLDDRQSQYRQAFWLRSIFENNVWDCQFEGSHRKSINFNITLPDGIRITDQKHALLLEIFKCFLCVQTHPDVTGRVKLSGVVSHGLVSRAIHLLDYFLLKAEYYQLHLYGLQMLTEIDLMTMLLDIGNHREVYQGVYCWHKQLSCFLKRKIITLSYDVIDKAVRDYPGLKVNNVAPVSRVLALTDEELLRARVWLFLNNFYHFAQRKVGAYKKIPNSAKLSELIYANTLGGKGNCFPVLPELGIEPVTHTRQEYRAVAVCDQNDTRQMREAAFVQYYRVFRHLGVLQAINLPIPKQALNNIKLAKLLQALNFKQSGRFYTLPSQMVFFLLRQAIEFCTNYGKDLVNSYLQMAKVANVAGKSLSQWLRGTDIKLYLTPTIQAFGVRKWLIQKQRSKEQAEIDRGDYFTKLRANEGFWELLRVFYGAVQVIVGTLMARRQDELIELDPLTCLDTSRKYLIFLVGKSGYDGKRERVARPIPAIAADMICLIKKLQTELKDIGVIDKYYPLFAYPHPRTKGLVNFGHMQFNCSLDYFCDYIQTPVNYMGQRYYVRQHQLRRFFAMLFFWGSSFGGMDTLRWFLAHTDVEHLYHYITESTPGKVLKDTKIHYATKQLQAYDKSAQELANLLELRFGIRKFDLMDSNELDDHIGNLIDEGCVNIEPEFLKTDDGKDYRILIKVREGQ